MAFIVRPSMSLDEAAAAQRIDDALWDRGYQHYGWLHETETALLLVAVEDERFGPFSQRRRIILETLCAQE